MRVDELADSAPLANDQAGLRRRLADDGYLFFRGLLPADELRATGQAVLAALRAGGWVDDRAVPSIEPRAVNSMDALKDPAFRQATTSAVFNRVPYSPALRAVVRRVLGPGSFSYPVKVLRAVYPERPQARPRGRYIHYDYGVAGVQDMLTSWIPLMDIPVRIGGLAVQPGGHLGPPRPPRPLSVSERGWATTSYEPGDVIIFHCLTPHAALPNTGSTLRISGDFRWQRPDQPAPAELILGPRGPGWASGGTVQPDVRPRVVVGTGSGRADPAAAGADGRGRAGTIPAGHRAPGLEALAPATAGEGALTGARRKDHHASRPAQAGAGRRAPARRHDLQSRLGPAGRARAQRQPGRRDAARRPREPVPVGRGRRSGALGPRRMAVLPGVRGPGPVRARTASRPPLPGTRHPARSRCVRHRCGPRGDRAVVPGRGRRRDDRPARGARAGRGGQDHRRRGPPDPGLGSGQPLSLRRSRPATPARW